MKKILAAIFLFFLLLSPAFADARLKVSPKLNGTLSFYQVFINPAMGVDLMFADWLGIGTDAELFYGINYRDLYFALNFRGNLGPFFLGAGGSCKVLSAQTSEEEITFVYGQSEELKINNTAINPMITAGLQFYPYSTDIYSVGVGAVFDYIITDIPVDLREADDLMEKIVVAIAQGTLGAIFGPLKFGAGVTVSF